MTLFQEFVGRWLQSTTFLGFFSSKDILFFWAYMRAVIYGMKKLTKFATTKNTFRVFSPFECKISRPRFY